MQVYFLFNLTYLEKIIPFTKFLNITTYISFNFHTRVNITTTQQFLHTSDIVLFLQRYTTSLNFLLFNTLGFHYSVTLCCLLCLSVNHRLSLLSSCALYNRRFAFRFSYMPYTNSFSVFSEYLPFIIAMYRTQTASQLTGFFVLVIFSLSVHV